MMVAYELFMANGYEETSVKSIVEKVKVPFATFYHYFKSKEDILEAILTSSMEKFSKN
jgi:AcrR family transcriptional regulator